MLTYPFTFSGIRIVLSGSFWKVFIVVQLITV
nr:MAG TPA: hypothetical protein [Caudoviricetes sp.]